MNKPTKVMLVEDNREFSTVIQLALEDEDKLELCSHFGTAEIALRSLKECIQIKKPDIILLDLHLPGMNGLEALPQFQKSAPEAKIIVLTQSEKKADVLDAIKFGAAGYLLKSASLSDIIDGIFTVVHGGATLDAGVAKYLLNTLQRHLPKDKPKVPLTTREIEVLNLIAEGKLKKQIADELNIGYSTVDTHVAHIYEKLDVNNAPSAINKAHNFGLFYKDA